MSSVVEKITLYDLLGYMVPGMVFLLFVTGDFFRKMPPEDLKYYEQYVGMITVAFVVCSYVCGIFMSELAKYVFHVLGNLRRDEDMKELQKHLPLEKALQESGLITDRIDIANEKYMKQYTKIIYGDIQADETFKRIHNYTSAEVLYKNLAMTFFVCAVIAGKVWCSWPAEQISLVALGGIIASIVFTIRSFDFNDKKRRYTMIWFVEKYCGKKA